jgi:serine/threonine protein phosphatase 1
MIKHFEKNTKGRDFAVGDIHGMFRALEYKLIEIGFDETKDRLFSVGDLVDRGPDSAEFDRWLAKPWFHAVKGNHEQMVVDAARDESMEAKAVMLHHINGGAWMTGLPTVEQQCYAVLCEDLPIAIEVETDSGLVGLIHAECPLDDWNLFKKLYATNAEYFDQVAMWSRKRISAGNESIVEGLHRLYVGHTPVKYVVTLGNVVYIDTGSCFTGGCLTIVQIN